MDGNRKRVLLAIIVGLLVAPSASLAEGSEAERARGVVVMPGGVIQGSRIVYEGGDVIVVPAAGQAFDQCLSGNVCLFAGVSWSGTMIMFSSCCAWNDLSAFGFDDTASSWRNRLGVDAQIAKGAGGGGAKLCLNNGSFASSMPSGWDNVASSLRVRDASTYC